MSTILDNRFSVSPTALQLARLIEQLIEEGVKRAEAERTPTAPKSGEEELTVRDVMRIKRVSERTVREWVNAEPPKLRHHRTPGGHLRFYRADVEA
jgi:excisionase family DNA binding protein